MAVCGVVPVANIVPVFTAGTYLRCRGTTTAVPGSGERNGRMVGEAYAAMYCLQAGVTAVDIGCSSIKLVPGIVVVLHHTPW